MKNRKARSWVYQQIARPVQMVLEAENMYYEFCGSWRRGLATVADLDVLLREEDLEIVADSMRYIFGEIDVQWSGVSKFAFVVKDFQVDFKNVPTESWGTGLLHHTGPAHYNIMMRARAKSRGMLLNEYGLYVRADRRWLAGTTEESIFKKLGMDFVAPEKRYGGTNPQRKKHKVEKNEWKIQGSAEKPYTVRFSAEGWKCTCPHYKYRHVECKHIKKVQNDLL